MRKILSFLVIFVLCAGCENYKADIDDYLSYCQQRLQLSGLALTLQSPYKPIQTQYRVFLHQAM